MCQIPGKREKNQEIGIKYHDFGLFLLEDDTGARIHSIAHKYMNDAEQISMEVFQQWITGRGKHPVSWKTITKVLHATNCMCVTWCIHYLWNSYSPESMEQFAYV